ncbi:helix-turn-helix domain-containing protein [Falsihalocynthiibacter arcticus]|uniref:HTH cro/C1-type domain-containing protein n=1 Tax=Falsihalocynthiibacter arcticus TaxID=1579316 RepID=A0A126V0Q0_9RHOB|nr:helix-turn-helix transcriptional regulator [Falsihalocynthiibacter arcticus]AML51883.1 hypothetical protein RC74_11965 [Falsihalocynthiibacter arcticus]
MSSIQVNSTLRQLGEDIRTARKKRRLSVADFCKRIDVSDKTLKKLESGDGGVRLETFAMALLALGELDRLENILDPAQDQLGLSLDHMRLPERIKNKYKNSGSHLRKIVAGRAATSIKITPGRSNSGGAHRGPKAASRASSETDDEGTGF